MSLLVDHQVPSRCQLGAMAHPKIQEMLNLAATDARRLRQAKSSSAARKAWIAFLEHSNRAVNRLEQYARDTGQTAKYKLLISKEIWGNDVAKFVRRARHNHEHGVEDTVISIRHSDRIVFPDGNVLGSPSIYIVTPEGKHVVASEQAGPTELLDASPGVRQVSLRPTVRMVPISGKDGEIMPPFVQIETEDEPEIAAAARIYLDWIKNKVAEFS